MSLSKEIKALIEDRFEAAELVDFLLIPVEDIIEMFSDEIEEHLEDVLEAIGYKNDPDN